MRVRKKAVIGRIDDRGEIQAHWQTIKDFCSMHKGRAVIVRAEIQPIEPSESLTNYVFGYLIPEVQQVFHDNGLDFTKRETYQALCNYCPRMQDETYEGNGQWKVRLKEWEELDSAEAVAFIEWTQRWCAENFYYVLEDPKR